MFEMTATEPKHFLHSLDQLAASRMKQKAVEVRQPKAIAIKKVVQRGRQSLAHQRRQFGAEHDTESIVLDIPAHDVFSIRPAPFADGENAGTTMRAIRGIAQHNPSRAITEQGRGNKHHRARIVDAQAKAAKIDREEEHMRAFGGMRETCCAGKAGNTAAAAKP